MAAADIHGAEPAFVGLLAAGENPKRDHADDGRPIKCAEDLGVGEPGQVFFERSGLFVFESAAEGFGVEAESFESDFAQSLDVGSGKLADGEGHS